MPKPNFKEQSYHYHRFLDEAGDTTFYGKGKTPILGTDGVSSGFILGMLKVNEPLDAVRQRVVELQDSIISDPYFAEVPSIQKQISKNQYYIHAKNDVPEVRKMVFEFLLKIDCSFECVVARKIYDLYEKKHNGNEAEFYADLLSHLLKNKFQKYDRLVLNIAERSRCTTHTNLGEGLNKAYSRAGRKGALENPCSVSFNVQRPTIEPLLNVADYFCWAIQRVFERGETRYYDYLFEKISLVIDLYDTKNYQGFKNYYSGNRRLTADNWLNK